MALPSSQVTPLNTCPALRPRWCPDHSPYRSQDCCLLTACRSSAFIPILFGTILLSTTIHISGFNHTACILVPSGSVLPLPGLHAEFTTDLLARLWSGGTCTHWVTLSNFNEQCHFPMIWAYLGASAPVLD